MSKTYYGSRRFSHTDDIESDKNTRGRMSGDRTFIYSSISGLDVFDFQSPVL